VSLQDVSRVKNKHSKNELVVIDLQTGISSIPTEPYTSKIVIENTVKILAEFRNNNMQVFLVHVTPSPDLKVALRSVSETTFQMSGTILHGANLFLS
jgi:nicotinamidase-related amidase